MSPSLGRSWTQYLVVGASVVVIVPLLDALSQSLVLTWLGVAVLGGATVLLFQWRRRFRTAFVLPLIYIALLAAIWSREQGGIDSTGISIAVGAFIVLCAAGLLADAFWSPYTDDLAEMEHPSQFKE
jgi:hypothetical protein